MMQRSLASRSTRLTGRLIDGAPVYEYVRTPGVPAVSVQRFRTDELPVGRPGDHAHAHDFLVLAYLVEGAGHLDVGDQEFTVTAGDAFVIAPGEVVRLTDHGHTAPTKGWCVFFPPELIGPSGPAGALGWRAHPLLFPLIGRGATGVQRLQVPPDERRRWSTLVADIERELAEPQEGSAEAALANLTLLLVSVARLAVDVGQDLRLRNEPLLAAVFEFIEAHYQEPTSLSHIAAAVGLTPGYLTTVVRRKTGRSVQRWITERRMAEARRLLRETDLTVEAIAIRSGYRQTSFFIKQFRRDHTVTPATWRHKTHAASSTGAGPIGLAPYI